MGGMYYASDGTELKKFNTVDGMGIKLLQEKGIIVGVITGKNTTIIKNRARKLKIDEVYQWISDKMSVAKKIGGEIWSFNQRNCLCGR